MPVIPPIVMFAGLWIAALSGAMLGAVAFFLVRRQPHLIRRWAEAEWTKREAAGEAALNSLNERVETLAAELRELREQKLQNAAGPLTARASGLDLTRRAQALRMHRRGDPPDQIAAMLKIPFQEVDLLLKVHRIVMDRI